MIFSTRNLKGEITVIIKGKENSVAELPSESQLEHELRALVSNGHSISMVCFGVLCLLYCYFAILHSSF